MNRLKWLFSFFIAIAMIQPAFAQSDAPTRYYLRLDYMKAAPGKGGEYVDLEKTVWKRIHEERLNAGIITGWSLYSVLFPSGTLAEYTHVTVNTYDDFSKTRGGFPASVLDKALKDKTESGRQKLFDRTMASRDIVRTEIFVLQELIPPHLQPMQNSYMLTI